MGQGRPRAGHCYLVSLLLSREDLLVELSALSLQVSRQSLVLLLQLGLYTLQVVCCFLNLQFVCLLDGKNTVKIVLPALDQLHRDVTVECNDLQGCASVQEEE